MAMTSRQRNLLVIGLVVTAWGSWILLSGDEPGVPGTSSAQRSSDRKSAAALTADKVPVVVSALGIPGPAETFERERNLFEYAQSPEELARIEAQRRLAAEEAQRRAQEAADAAARQAEAERLRLEQERERQRLLALEKVKQPVIPPKPVPPSFPYQYVGTIGPVDAPFAILTGPDKQYRYIRAGDTIDREFKLEYIAERRLDLSYTDPRFQDQFTQVQRLSDATPRSR